MTYGKHAIFLTVIFSAVLLINFTLSIITNIPLKNQLSSDAELHLTHWREFSTNEGNDFANDEMFRKDTRPRGELLVNKLLVRLGEWLKVGLLEWSIWVSSLSLVVFLSGIYFVVAYSLKKPWLGFLVALGSIIPAFSLGGSTWGFLAQGFLPRELALGIAVWIMLIYFYGLEKNRIWVSRLVFLLAGIFSNWYPVLFFHFAAVFFIAEIIRLKSIRKELLIYGLLYAAGASFALMDIFIKSAQTAPIDLEVFRFRFRYMLLSSFEYTFLRYLRRFLIYIAIVTGLFIFSKKTLNSDELRPLSPWYAIWLSAALISLAGIVLENFTTFARFLFSRASVWFLFASMVIIAYTIHRIYEKKVKNSLLSSTVLATGILLIFTGQSAIPSIYRQIKDLRINSANYNNYISLLENLKEVTPNDAIILASPREANKIRAYGARGTYVSWKEGGIALLDGKSGREWFERLHEVDAVFGQKNLEALQKYAQAKNIRYIIYNTNEISNDNQQLTLFPLLKSGPFVLSENLNFSEKNKN